MRRNWFLALLSRCQWSKSQPRKLIRPDLEKAAGVGKLMHIIEDDDRPLDRTMEVLGVAQTFGDAGEITV